ncbi:GAF domain-containing protein [Acinetobacter soli]|nr:GAF domain-containing protein [Acinetobacter soli]WEH91599.1 GAF domain-containing protein [Acinetobacter soli]WEH96951.1 GAF domain-containing protein [Acinetobacter soli]
MSNNVNEVTQLNTETAYWRTQEMLLLQQVTSLASKQLNTQIVFREILHLMSELLGLNRGRIILLEDNKKFGSIKYAYGLTRQEVERGRYALGEGITGSVLEMGQTIIVQNIDEDHNFLARSVKRENLPQEIVSFYALPIQVDSKTVGVLACHRIRLRRRMMNDDLTILKILTTMISQILYMHQHIEDKTSALALQNDWLKKCSIRTVHVMVLLENPPSSQSYHHDRTGFTSQCECSLTGGIWYW